jgi:hypothetical protein
MEIHHLKIINAQGKKEAITIKLNEQNRYCYLIAESIAIGKMTFDDIDYWGCLTKLREVLEVKGYLILCRGAKENIVLSGMCRNMGLGLNGYEIELGKSAELENLVPVFEPIESGAVTLEIQENFKQKWLGHSS